MALPPDLQAQLDRLRPKDEATEPTKPTVYVDGEPYKSPLETEAETEVSEAPEAEDAPAEPSSVDDIRLNLERERASREAMEKELQFLRSAALPPKQPDQPQPDPVAQYLPALAVDEDTWTQMLADPKHGAARLTEMAQRMFVLGNQVAKAQTLAETQAILDARDAALRRDSESSAMHQEFWRRNPDLEQYRETVQGVAALIATDKSQAGKSAEELMTEVSRRTRAALKSYGVETAVPQKVKSPTRLRPATADMGAVAGQPKPNLTAKEKQIYALAGRRVA